MNRAQERKILHRMMLRYGCSAIVIYMAVFLVFVILKWIIARFISFGPYAEGILYLLALIGDLWLTSRIMYTRPVNDFVKHAFGPDID